MGHWRYKISGLSPYLTFTQLFHVRLEFSSTKKWGPMFRSHLFWKACSHLLGSLKILTIKRSSLRGNLNQRQVNITLRESERDPWPGLLFTLTPSEAPCFTGFICTLGGATETHSAVYLGVRWGRYIVASSKIHFLASVLIDVVILEMSNLCHTNSSSNQY